MAAVQNAAHRTTPGTRTTPVLSRDRVEFERCSPWSTPFPPQPPPSTGPLCSAGSQVLWRSQTSPGRTRPSCGLGLHGPIWIVRPRHPGDLPVLVYVVSQRARGLRLRRTDEPLASSAVHRVAFPLSGESRHPGTMIFRSSKPGPLIPLSTLRPTPHDATARLEARMDALPPFLWGSFIPYNMPVYPGAFPEKSSSLTLRIACR